MRRFKVEAETEVLVIRDGEEWIAKNFRNHKTERANILSEEELILDPERRTGCNRDGLTIGDLYTQMGFFGFRRDGWAILVPAEAVNILS